jgi:hypothetical protein
VNGGGADDSMVDLSEDVTEVSPEETASGSGSISEQNSRLAETSLSSSARHVAEVETVKTQVSVTSLQF